MRRTVCIQIDQANDRNTCRFKAEHICSGKGLGRLDARRETVSGGKLAQHDRGRFIDEAAAGDAKNGMLALPFRRQFVLVQDRQIFIRRIVSHAFHRRSCFRVAGRTDLGWRTVVLFGKIVGKFAYRVSDLC